MVFLIRFSKRKNVHIQRFSCEVLLSDVLIFNLAGLSIFDNIILECDFQYACFILFGSLISFLTSEILSQNVFYAGIVIYDWSMKDSYMITAVQPEKEYYDTNILERDAHCDASWLQNSKNFQQWIQRLASIP